MKEHTTVVAPDGAEFSKSAGAESSFERALGPVRYVRLAKAWKTK
ncbi:hypothetical protein [Haloprofundus sp. MHR1]|nr:hypothetical protein [Haloprofundus sp. MHR1]